MGKKNLNEPIFVIDNLETLKVLADPLRLQILELLILRPQTVKELGAKLGLTANKLYYHVNQLEEQGLVRVVETRQVANMIEKTYGATTQELDIDPDLLSFTTSAGRENVHTMVLSTIDATREDLLRSLLARAFELDQGAAEQPREVLINRTLSRMSEERAQEFKTRLAELMDEFSAGDRAEHDQAFALTIVYYPTFYYPAAASDTDLPAGSATGVQ